MASSSVDGTTECAVCLEPIGAAASVALGCGLKHRIHCAECLELFVRQEWGLGPDAVPDDTTHTDWSRLKGCPLCPAAPDLPAQIIASEIVPALSPTLLGAITAAAVREAAGGFADGQRGRQHGRGGDPRPPIDNAADASAAAAAAAADGDADRDGPIAPALVARATGIVSQLMERSVLRCPSCAVPFLPESDRGCDAVWCSNDNCRRAFCLWCLADCGDDQKTDSGALGNTALIGDAHDHVKFNDCGLTGGNLFSGDKAFLTWA